MFSTVMGFLFALLGLVVFAFAFMGVVALFFTAGRRSVHRELLDHEGEILSFSVNDGVRYRGRFFLEKDSK